MNIRKLEDITKEELIEIVNSNRSNEEYYKDLIKRLRKSPTSEIMQEAADAIILLLGKI